MFKSTAVVGSMTMISRLLGFVRDMIFARMFGADAGTDAFFVAFKIPNFLRRLFAEGAFSQAFVPLLSEYSEKEDRQRLKDFINRTSGTLAVVLVLVTAIGVLAAPWLVMVFAPGFYLEGERYDLTVSMLRITFPYLFFISLTALAGSILNTFGRFAVPAFTPVFLNICLIAAAVWISPMLEQPIVALAWGVFAAGIVQLAFQVPALARLGLLPRMRPDFHHNGVRRVMQLMLPAIFGVSVTQINLLFDTLIASFLAAGSVSWLYYSDRLVEFPLGVFGVAMATVILPHLSRNYAGRDSNGFSAGLDWGLRWVVLIGLPATAGLMLLSEAMMMTLFQYNEFTVNDARQASFSLVAYAVGLLAFILVKILVPGFSSRQDTRTPVRFGVYSMLVNMVLNVVFVFHLAHVGLALATSLAAFVNAGLLFARLRRDQAYIPLTGWRGFFGRTLLACGGMITVVAMLDAGSDWAGWSAAQRVLHLGLYTFAGMAAYTAILWLTGMRGKHLTLASADSAARA